MALKFTKLNKALVKKLEAGKSITEHGIRFDRLPNGDGKFSVNIMVDGQRIHRSYGKQSEGVTRNKVENYISQLKTDARAGRLKLPSGRKLVVRFDEAAENYLTRQEQEGGKDLKMKRMRLRHNLVPFFKEKPLSEIKSFDIERFKKSRLDTGKRPSTVNRDLAALSHLYSMAEEWGWLEHRPSKIKLLKENSGRIDYLTVKEIDDLLFAAERDECKRTFSFIKIALDTSMRRMEILSIQIKNINLSKRIIYIPQAKGGAREQPITKPLAIFLKNLLEEASKDQKWLFPSARSSSGHVVAIEKPFRRVVVNAGLDVKRVVRHTLRHTAITHLVQSGVDLPTVQRISGHKSLSMVSRYSHQNGAHIEAAMDKLEKKYKVS
jgi:integrase